MCGSGSPTGGPTMVNACKAADVKGVETLATAQGRVEAARREAEDARMKQLIQQQLYGFFATQETPMPLAAAGEEDSIPGGNVFRADGLPQQGSYAAPLTTFGDRLREQGQRPQRDNLQAAQYTFDGDTLVLHVAAPPVVLGGGARRPRQRSTQQPSSAYSTGGSASRSRASPAQDSPTDYPSRDSEHAGVVVAPSWAVEHARGVFLANAPAVTNTADGGDEMSLDIARLGREAATAACEPPATKGSPPRRKFRESQPQAPPRPPFDKLELVVANVAHAKASKDKAAAKKRHDIEDDEDNDDQDSDEGLGLASLVGAQAAATKAAWPTGKGKAARGKKRGRVRKLLATACVTYGITPAFGQRLGAVVHSSVEAIDDGHRFRSAYLRKHWETHVHNGDTWFALDVVRERYLRHGTDNLGSPEFTGLTELHKDRSARPGREAVAPRATFTKDVTKDSGKGKAKAEAPAGGKAD
eukprot:jgi/Tetstr1/462909/TSEL_007857.t1